MHAGELGFQAERLAQDDSPSRAVFEAGTKEGV
jgi:hypothetical protein